MLDAAAQPGNLNQRNSQGRFCPRLFSLVGTWRQIMQTTLGASVQQPRQGPVLSEAFMQQVRRTTPEPFGDFRPDNEPDEGVPARVGTEFECDLLGDRRCLALS